MQPVTPPRSRGRRSPENKTIQLARGLYTPKTPFGKRIDHKKELFSPPVSYKPIHVTPGSTPRHSTRKKKEQGDAITLFPTPQTSSRALFPPTSIPIGSGRTKHNSNVFPQTLSMNSIESSSIRNQMMNILEDSPLKASPTKRKLIFDEILKEEEEQDQTPSTPTGKLITDEMIRDWNKNTFRNDDDNDSTEFMIKRARFENPFLTTGSPKLCIHRNKTSETELKLINKKGEKITRTLTLEEQSFKPKNLFNDLKSVSKVKKFQVFNDDE